VKLELITPFLSISSFETIQIPNLTVLTGENGSGKSHILQGILSEKIAIYDDSGTKVDRHEIRLFSPEDLRITSGQSRINFSPNRQSQNINQHDHVRHQLRMINQNFGSFSDREAARNSLRQLLGYRASAEIEKISGKSIADFTEEEYSLYIDTLENRGSDPFLRNISDIFVWYVNRTLENDYKEYFHKNHARDEGFLSKKEFLINYGDPPWDVVNDILQNIGIPYKINSPDPNIDIYQPLLEHKDGAKIPIEWLSSGEKILISIAFSLFVMNEWRTSSQIPKVLLFDEIDAFLHPSMLKQLLNMLNLMFIEKYKISVILVTHAPTTVALSPEESLYLVRRQAPRLERVSIDSAIAALTADVRTVSVRLENRRQVFVESEYDEEIYNEIYSQIRRLPEVNLNSEISITFIASGRGGQGNCDAVEHLVKNLNNNGNRSVFGILDWDKKRFSRENLLVISEGRRYAIENLIFDPCLMAYFLMREGYIEKKKLGISENENHISFLNFSDRKMQEIVESLLAIYAEGIEISDNNLTDCYYINESLIRIPNWYLRWQGHDMEERWKTVFPGLNTYHKEGQMKRKVISTAFKELYGFIPFDFIEIFRQIQN
jgi:predicted ATP-binding protein involved in virulence